MAAISRAAASASSATLLAAFWEADPPERVRRAMFRVEYATWQRYADLTLTMIVGGLEALLKIGRSDLTAQFKRRVSALAAELNVEGVDEDFCGRMYDGRSAWVHGSRVELFDPGPKEDGVEDEDERDVDEEERASLDEIARLQVTLRRALRRAVQDSEFRAIFDADDLIADRWPA